jgi:nucleoside-diphosphate-sugar epimerase
MRVLVTGGTGYLGSAIVRALVKRGHEPIVFARRVSDVGGGVRAIAGDLRSRPSVEDAVAQADAVCHTGALVSLWRQQPSDFDDVNVLGTWHVLDACRAHRTSRIVYTSSFLAMPPAGATQPMQANDYQRTKVQALALVRQAVDAQLPVVTMIPGVIYGPGPATEGNLVGRLLRDHLGGRLPAIVGPDRLWPFVWVDDVAEAHAVALERGVGGREYALGGEVAPQKRIFEIARDVTGRRPPWTMPGWIAHAAGALEEARAGMTGRPPLITRGAVAIFRRDWPLDSGPAGVDLGFRPLRVAKGITQLLGDLT